MNFLQKLESHTGGLLHIKSDLFWFGGRGWDAAPGGVCLLLDATATTRGLVVAWARRHGCLNPRPGAVAVALLLIDDRPQWVWMTKEDVEVLNAGR